jgi:hypothetical protein
VSDSGSEDGSPHDAAPDEIVGGDDVIDVDVDETQPDPAPVAPLPAADPAPVPPAQPLDTGYTMGGVPTFDSVREKIETRYGTAIGATELASETPEGRTVEEQYDARQRAAAERLEQIRASMRDPEPGQT